MGASLTAAQTTGMQRSVAIEKALRQISRQPIPETHAALLEAVRSTEDALLVAQMWYDAMMQAEDATTKLEYLALCSAMVVLKDPPKTGAPELAAAVKLAVYDAIHHLASLGDETVNETLHDLLSVWDAEEHICLTHSRLAQLRNLIQKIDVNAGVMYPLNPIVKHRSMATDTIFLPHSRLSDEVQRVANKYAQLLRDNIIDIDADGPGSVVTKLVAEHLRHHRRRKCSSHSLSVAAAVGSQAFTNMDDDELNDLRDATKDTLSDRIERLQELEERLDQMDSSLNVQISALKAQAKLFKLERKKLSALKNFLQTDDDLRICVARDDSNMLTRIKSQAGATRICIEPPRVSEREAAATTTPRAQLRAHPVAATIAAAPPPAKTVEKGAVAGNALGAGILGNTNSSTPAQQYYFDPKSARLRVDADSSSSSDDDERNGSDR